MTRQQPKQKRKPNEAQAVTIIAGALAIGASVQATATTLSAALGIPVAVLSPILTIAMSRPIHYGIITLPSAGASSESQRLEATYRAHYVWAASQRLLQAIRLGRRDEALAAEKTYFNQHMDAMSNRREAAAAVDKAAKRYGDNLGWYAKIDSRTSPECRAANGKNFSASRLPSIGWPGAVHPRCRCKPGRKHATSQTVYNIKPDRKAS